MHFHTQYCQFPVEGTKTMNYRIILSAMIFLEKNSDLVIFSHLRPSIVAISCFF